MNEATPIEPTSAARAIREARAAAPMTPTARVFLDLIGRLRLVEETILEIARELPKDARAATELATVADSLGQDKTELWSYMNWTMIDAPQALEDALTSVGLLPLAPPLSSGAAAQANAAEPVSMDRVITKDGQSLLRLYCIMAQVQHELEVLGKETNFDTQRAADLGDNLSGFMDNIAECIDIDAVRLPAWKEVRAASQRQQATPEEKTATLTQSDL